MELLLYLVLFLLFAGWLFRQGKRLGSTGGFRAGRSRCRCRRRR